MTVIEYLDNVKKMIDDLKAMCANLGLANTGDEYKIISELFTYKFLNDKLLREFENRTDKDETFDDYVEWVGIDLAMIPEKFLLNNLFERQNEPDFHKLLDEAFITISEMNKDIYSIETESGKKKPLFEPLSAYLRDEDKENQLAVRSINILCEYDFDDIYDEGWDYFSSVFEYLISDYNKDSGKYAEYYTPAFAGRIMAEILLGDEEVDKVSVYDPAAGSGTLLLSMANAIGVNNCTIYSQDISQKSSQFLRINLILNKLAHSLSNVIEGNTLTKPQHLDGDDLMHFDYIVSNPPFKMDFSSDIEDLKADKYQRFFAGLPNIPKRKKTDMAIYQVFIQHIMASLNADGKAAFVVPTGFLTAKTGIPKAIREAIVDNRWLKAVISMPSQIFANTGTNVSIVFIDKTHEGQDTILVDASKLGETIKTDDGQRTFLSKEEIELIIDTAKNMSVIDDFSVVVSLDDIKAKSYSFSAGQYFEIKIEYVDITAEEFKEKMNGYKASLAEKFQKGHDLEQDIMKQIGGMKL